MTMIKNVEQRNIAGTRYSFIGKTVSSGILFILSIIVARYLGPDAFGELSLALMIIVFASVFIDAGLNRSTQKHISQYLGENTFLVGITYKKMLLIKIASALVAMIFLYITSDLFALLFNSTALRKLLKIGSVFLAATILLEFGLVVLQGYEDFKRILQVNILEATLKILMTIAIIYVGLDVAGIMGGYALSSLIMSVFLILVLYFMIKPGKASEHNSIRLTKEIIAYSPPIFLSTLFFLVYTKFDILVLGYFEGTTYVGYYSLAIGLIDNLLIPLVAIETAVMPIAASLFVKDQNKAHLSSIFNQTIVNGFFFMMPVIAGLVVVSYSFIKEAYGIEFIESAFILIALTPFILTKTLAILNGAYLIGANKANIFMKYTFGAMFLNIVLLFLLIPTFGVYGAVASKIISHSILTFSILVYIVKYFQIKIDNKAIMKCSKIILSSIMMAIFSYFILKISGGEFLGLALTVCSGVVLYILFLHLTKAISVEELTEIAFGKIEIENI
ncbi:flippase [Methanolobus sp. ZRKC2]|uniref:flippase n=1 Tax=Methanolobus sp. ZRKC2 TaxID=3125783 RepID=UPI0032473886